MKTLIAFGFSLFLSLLSGPVYADYLQIFDGTGRYYVSYAQVYVRGTLYGYTDMYGRIRIDLPSGNYFGEVDVRGGRKKIEFTIDGARHLKRINARG